MRYFGSLLILFSSQFIGITNSVNASSDSSSPEQCFLHRNNNILYQVKLDDVLEVNQFIGEELSGKLKQIPDSNFKFISGVRNKEEIYYDTKDEILYQTDRSLSHSVTSTLPKYNSERERIFLGQIGDGEFIKEAFEVRRYATKSQRFDKHPIIGKIKRNERQIVFEKLGLDDAQLSELSENIRVVHDQYVFIVSLYGTPVLELALTGLYSSSYGISTNRILLGMEILPTTIGYLQDGEKYYLNELACSMDSTVNSKLDLIPFSEDITYGHLISDLNEKFSYRHKFRKYPLLIKVSQAIFLTFFGFLFLYLLLGRYVRDSSVRTIKRR